jgi:hypothetical protein
MGTENEENEGNGENEENATFLKKSSKKLFGKKVFIEFT